MNENQLRELRIELSELFNFWETREQDIIILLYLQKKYPNACKYMMEQTRGEYDILNQEIIADVLLKFDQENDLTQNYN